MKFVAIVIGVYITFLNSMICTCDEILDFAEDAKQIKKVMERSELQTEQEIFDILLDRTNAQRQEIARQFLELYNQSIIEELKKFFVYDIKETITALMIPNDHFNAYELHHAIEGFGTDEGALSEILGSMSRNEVLKVSEIYKNDYGVSLKDDIISDTSGSFKDLLVALCDTERSEDTLVFVKDCIRDAQALYDTRKGRQDYDRREAESTFRKIFTTRSRHQLRSIFDEYKRISNSSIIQAIKDHFSAETRYAYLIIMKTAVFSKSQFYAIQLRESMLGIGTNDRQLVRIIVGRSEIDLQKN